MVSSLRCRGHAAGLGDPRAGPRTVRVASHPPADHRAPLPVPGLRSRVATGHQPGGRAPSADLPRRAALGAHRDRVPAPHRRPGRRRSRGVMEHRQRCGPRRGSAGAHQRPGPVRWRAGHRRGRARVASHPPRGQVRHRHHGPHPDPGRNRPGPAVGHGRRPVQSRVQGLARRPPPGVARRCAGGRDGRVHRVQDRCGSNFRSSKDLDPTHHRLADNHRPSYTLNCDEP